MAMDTDWAMATAGPTTEAGDTTGLTTDGGTTMEDGGTLTGVSHPLVNVFYFYTPN